MMIQISQNGITEQRKLLVEASQYFAQGPPANSRSAFTPLSIISPPPRPPAKPAWENAPPKEEERSPPQYNEAAPPLNSYQAINRLAEAETAAEPAQPAEPHLQVG